MSSRPTHQLGVSSSRGWNMLTIPACRQPPEYPHLRHPWAISPRFSLSLRRNWLFPLSSSTCGAVGRHGVLPEWPSRGQNKRLADRRRDPNPDYQVGQQVWLSTKHVPLRTESKKLAPRFIGPFTVQAVLNPVTVWLSLPRSTRTHNVFHVSQVRRVRTSCFAFRAPRLGPLYLQP